MKIEPVNNTPEGVRIIKNQSDHVILEYLRLNEAINLLLKLSQGIAFIFFMLMAVSDALPGLKNSFVLELIIAIIITIIIALANNNSWMKIEITKDVLTIGKKNYQLSECQLTCHFHEEDKKFQFWLKYGAQDIYLPCIKRNGYEVVNFINREVNYFKNVGMPQADYIPEGRLNL